MGSSKALALEAGISFPFRANLQATTATEDGERSQPKLALRPLQVSSVAMHSSTGLGDDGKRVLNQLWLYII